MVMFSFKPAAFAALLAVSLFAASSSAQQFTCTMSASDENACLDTTADNGDNCVWCALSSFGFCVNEEQAESMEKNLPGIECDRKSDSVDDDSNTPSADDKVPAFDDYAGFDDDNKNTDDAAASDDKVAPSDDNVVPDNYWECLKAKTEKDCQGNCTWCETKAGFGLCMSGPSADSASHSDWFDCKNDSMFDEHVSEKKYLRVTAPTKTTKASDPDPYDTSCVLAFLQDQTKQACVAATDETGQACEYCSLQGMVDICLTEFQAEEGSALGITCDSRNNNFRKQQEPVDDLPLDTTCLQALLQQPSHQACINTLDVNGDPCEWCTMGGSLPLCLSGEQADVAGELGIRCGDESDDGDYDNLLDTSCVMSGANDAGACQAMTTQDNKSCQYCTMFGGMIPVCLSTSQAFLAQKELGASCETPKEKSVTFTTFDSLRDDPYDISCLEAYLQDPTADGCTNAQDEDGKACEYCSVMGSVNLCLTETQAAAGEDYGVQCTSASNEFVKDIEEHNDEQVDLPPDFLKCLTNYKEDSCESNSCTWCNTRVGMGFCMAPAAADALKDCTFFDCVYLDQEEQQQQRAQVQSDPYDLACMAAGMGSDDAESDCHDTTDGEGQACVWCNAAGVFGVCVSAEQAATVSTFLECDTAMMA